MKKKLLSTHIKRALLSNMSLEMCKKEKEMRKEFTHMITSTNYINKTPESSSWMF